MSADTPVQYVSDDSGNAIAVIVPIEVWREIESERETANLLKSDTMRKRLLEAKDRIQETAIDPFGGIGKPEPLKHELASCWSKRIDDEHRLVYQVTNDKIRILACRYH